MIATDLTLVDDAAPIAAGRLRLGATSQSGDRHRADRRHLQLAADLVLEPGLLSSISPRILSSVRPRRSTRYWWDFLRRRLRSVRAERLRCATRIFRWVIVAGSRSDVAGVLVVLVMRPRSYQIRHIDDEIWVAAKVPKPRQSGPTNAHEAMLPVATIAAGGRSAAAVDANPAPSQPRTRLAAAGRAAGHRRAPRAPPAGLARALRAAPE